MIDSSFYISDYIGAFTINRNKSSFRTEKRNFSVLSYRYFGETEFNQEGNSVKIEEAQVVFIPPDTVYSQSSSKDEILTAIHFNSNYPIFERITPIKTNENSEIKNLFIKLAELSAGGKENHLESLSLFYSLLKILFGKDTDNMKPDCPKALKEAINIFNSRFYSKKVCVSSVADSLNVSGSYLRHIFSVYLGISPAKYLLRLRIDNAKRLLESGYYSVSEISEMCGYQDPKTFSVAFKGATGKSPVQYIKSLI